MYFWNVEKLKEDLKKQTVAEGEFFKYLFATVVLYCLGLMLPYTADIWYKLSTLLMTIITASGLYYVFKCNGGKNGKNFLEKYTSLGWVVSVRWSVLVALPSIIISLIILGVIGPSLYVIEGFLIDLVYVSYFWMLGKHIKDTVK